MLSFLILLKEQETPLLVLSETQQSCREESNVNHVNLWPEIRRKLFHLFPGFLGPAILYVLLYYTTERIAILSLLVLASLLTILFTIHEIGLKKGFAEKVPFVSLMFKFMKRDIEVQQKTFFGSILYFGSIAFMLLVLHPLVALLAVLVSANADGVAAILGQWKGHMKNPLNPKKTLEGSLGFIISGFLLTLLGLLWFHSFYFFYLTWSSLALILGINLLTACAEALPRTWYWDQLTVPLTYGLLFQSIFSYPWFPLFT